MKFLENDLEEIIYTSGRDVLEERGLLIEGELKRQLKIGNYGSADLVSITKPRFVSSKFGIPYDIELGEITIYELKKEQIGIAAFLQALNYVKGIKEYLKYRNKEHLFTINMTLIGKKIDTTGSFCFISEMLQIQSQDKYDWGMIEFYTYDYKIDGLHFYDQNNFVLTNQGF